MRSSQNSEGMDLLPSSLNLGVGVTLSMPRGNYTPKEMQEAFTSLSGDTLPPGFLLFTIYCS